jgi:hypothetical protein
VICDWFDRKHAVLNECRYEAVIDRNRVLNSYSIRTPSHSHPVDFEVTTSSCTAVLLPHQSGQPEWFQDLQYIYISNCYLGSTTLLVAIRGGGTGILKSNAILCVKV